MSDQIVPGLNIAEYIQFLDENVGEPIRRRPDGFGITAKEYAKAKGCSEDIARKILDKAVGNGLFDKEKMVIDDNGGNPPTVYFKSPSKELVR